MDRTTAMFKRKNKETLDTSHEKKLSPFPRYAVTVVLCTLICCVGFVFLMFKTNTIFSVDNVELTTGYKNPRVSVTSTTSAIEQDEVDVPGVAPALSGEWYSQVPNEMQRKGNVVETLNMSDGTLNVYDGLPWDYDPSCYVYNVQVACNDMVNYLDTVAGTPSNLDINTQFTYEKSSQSCIGSIDSIPVLFSPFAPCVVTQDYNNGFTADVNGWLQGGTPDAALYGKYSNGTGRKYCLIVEENGETKYIPLASKDSKGHTWPGGVIQTNLQIASAVPGPDSVFSINVGDLGPRNHQMTIKDFVLQLDTLDGGQGESLPVRAYVKNCLEIYGGDGSDCRTLSKYAIVGYIAWPN